MRRMAASAWASSSSRYGPNSQPPTVSMYRERISRGHDFDGVCAQSEQRDSPGMARRRPQRVQAALAASLA